MNPKIKFLIIQEKEEVKGENGAVNCQEDLIEVFSGPMGMALNERQVQVVSTESKPVALMSQMGEESFKLQKDIKLFATPCVIQLKYGGSLH